MPRHTTLANALLVAGVALLVAPVLFPIQPVLYHDTHRGTVGNESQIQADGYEIVAYENLSERGQQLYVRTLRAGGEYRAPVDEGAPDFAYPSPTELADVRDYRNRNALQGIVVERPPDADLPPPHEPVEAAERSHRHAEERGTEPEQSVEERRRQIARYDVMTTRTDRPPLTASSALLRLLSTAAGVLALGTGGYLRSAL